MRRAAALYIAGLMAVLAFCSAGISPPTSEIVGPQKGAIGGLASGPISTAQDPYYVTGAPSINSNGDPFSVSVSWFDSNAVDIKIEYSIMPAASWVSDTTWTTLRDYASSFASSGNIGVSANGTECYSLDSVGVRVSFDPEGAASPYVALVDTYVLHFTAPAFSFTNDGLLTGGLTFTSAYASEEATAGDDTITFAEMAVHDFWAVNKTVMDDMPSTGSGGGVNVPLADSCRAYNSDFILCYYVNIASADSGASGQTEGTVAREEWDAIDYPEYKIWSVDDTLMWRYGGDPEKRVRNMTGFRVVGGDTIWAYEPIVDYIINCIVRNGNYYNGVGVMIDHIGKGAEDWMLGGGNRDEEADLDRDGVGQDADTVWTYNAEGGPELFGHVDEREAFVIAGKRCMDYFKSRAAAAGISDFRLILNGTAHEDYSVIRGAVDGIWLERIRRNNSEGDLYPHYWADFKAICTEMADYTESSPPMITWEYSNEDADCTADSMAWYVMGAAMLQGVYSAWNYDTPTSRRGILPAPDNPIPAGAGGPALPTGSITFNEADSSATRAYDNGDSIKLKWNGTDEDCPWDWAVKTNTGSYRYFFPGDRNYWDQYILQKPTLDVNSEISAADLDIDFIPAARTDSVKVEIATTAAFDAGQDSATVAASDSTATFADATDNKYYVRARAKRFSSWSDWSATSTVDYSIPAASNLEFQLSNADTNAAGDSLQVDVFARWDANVSTRTFLAVLDSAFADSTGKSWESADDTLSLASVVVDTNMVPSEADSTVRLAWTHSTPDNTDYYQLQGYRYGEGWRSVFTADDDSTGITFDTPRGVYNFRIRAINSSAAPDSATAWTYISSLYKHQADLILGYVHFKNADGVIASTVTDTAYYYAYQPPTPLAITDLTSGPWEQFDEIIITGTKFGASKGKVTVSDNGEANFDMGNTAEQTENPWTDTEVTIASLAINGSWIDKDNLTLRLITATPETVFSDIRLFSTTAPGTSSFTPVVFDTSNTSNVRLDFAAVANEECLAWWRWKQNYDGSYSPAVRWYSSTDHTDTTMLQSITDTLYTGVSTANLDSAWVLVNLKDKAQNIRQLGPFKYEFTREAPPATAAWTGDICISNHSTGTGLDSTTIDHWITPEETGIATHEARIHCGNHSTVLPAWAWNESDLSHGTGMNLNDTSRRIGIWGFGETDSMAGATVDSAMLYLYTNNLELLAGECWIVVDTSGVFGDAVATEDDDSNWNYYDASESSAWSTALSNFTSDTQIGYKTATSYTDMGGTYQFVGHNVKEGMQWLLDNNAPMVFLSNVSAAGYYDQGYYQINNSNAAQRPYLYLELSQ